MRKFINAITLPAHVNIKLYLIGFAVNLCNIEPRNRDALFLTLVINVIVAANTVGLMYLIATKEKS